MKIFVAVTSLVVAIILFALVFNDLALAISIRELLGIDKSGSEQSPQTLAEIPDAGAEPPAKIHTQNPVATTLKYEEIRTILDLAEEGQRKTVLSDEETFRNFVKNEAANKSVMAAASANNIDQDERNLFIAKRGAENILREIYLKQLIASKIPADFPSEQQVADYYEKNREKFVLEERIYVWQIFLPLTEKMDQKEKELQKKKAESILTDLKKDKIRFGEAARKYSEHQQSKYNGGYMGLIKLSDLKPEIKKTLLTLEEEKISSAVTSADGIHIFKRGPTVEEQPVNLNEVKDQIQQLLLTQANKDIRDAVYQQAMETYPVDINDKKIEEWRLKLRTNIPRQDTVSNTQ